MTNELYHHGIKGQKWGVRRYQNADGTLTSEGKKRYDDSDSGNTSTKRTTNKDRKNMSDEQLKSRISRLKLEKELKNLEKDTIDDGKAYATDILKEIGKKTVTTAVTGAVLYAGKVAISKQFDAVELGDAVFRGGAKKK
jgi:hypothetical protein